MNTSAKWIACIFIGFAIGLVAGCANTGIKHVSADEFIRQAKTMEQMNSASGTFYVGASPTRAYVERTGLYKLFRCHKAIVYWTELESLPAEMVDQLRAGNPPWRPWYEKTEGKDNQMLENIGTNAGDLAIRPGCEGEKRPSRVRLSQPPGNLETGGRPKEEE